MTAVLKDVAIAIYDRLTASCTSDYARGVFHQMATTGTAPAVGAKPYVTFHIQATPDDTFTSNGWTINGTVQITDHRDNGMVPMYDLLERVYGNNLPPDTAPTYGLHRHVLTVSGNNIPDMIRVLDITPNFLDDADAVGLVVVFELTHTKGADS